MYLFKIVAVHFEGKIHVLLITWYGETQTLAIYTVEEWERGTPYNAK